MAYTKEQRRVIRELENLVHHRFNKKDLQRKVNEIFGLKNQMPIVWNCYIDGGLSDHNAMFSTYNFLTEDNPLCGDFDIYYLKCKKPNEDGMDVYVTEIGYEFL